MINYLVSGYRNTIDTLYKNIVNFGKLGKFDQPYRLHFGCGVNYLDGWINVDNVRHIKKDIYLQLGKNPLPIQDCSCSVIYSEHFIEHLSPKEANFVLKESNRVLVSGGTIRIAMPSLKYVVDRYLSKDWRDQDWLKNSVYKDIQTPAHMINASFRYWGHQWLYDEEEISNKLSICGFENICFVSKSESELLEFRNLETRLDSKLIVEARKP